MMGIMQISSMELDIRDLKGLIGVIHQINKNLQEITLGVEMIELIEMTQETKLANLVQDHHIKKEMINIKANTITTINNNHSNVKDKMITNKIANQEMMIKASALMKVSISLKNEVMLMIVKVLIQIVGAEEERIEMKMELEMKLVVTSKD